MKQSSFSVNPNKPDIEINKPGEVRFWQRPNVTLVLYLLFFAAMWYLWQSGKKQ